MVELLLAKGADVQAKDKGGLVPLHNACSYGHTEVVELLVQKGANVNVTDLWKFTPLHEATSVSITLMARIQSVWNIVSNLSNLSTCHD